MTRTMLFASALLALGWGLGCQSARSGPLAPLGPVPAVTEPAVWPEPSDLPEPPDPPPPFTVEMPESEPTPRTERPAEYVVLSSGHGPEYRWIVGELHYVYVRDAWRLRFVGATDDPCGGSVTLVDTGSMASFHNGQRVRVTGSLVENPPEGPSPSYRVESIEAVEPPQ